jgi:aminoglycoside phosphotransferase (APT) family kinase protein
VPDIDQRDPAEVAGTIARWLTSRLGEDSSPEVTDVEAPASNGFSNETILCTVRYREGGLMRERPLVVRVAPTKHTLFPDAEFSTQYRVMRTLAESGSGVPLPPLGWYEEDPNWFGVPFFTMDRVDGQVPTDNIPYTMEGWVIEATPDEQERMWWSGIEAMAAVHRTDWRSLDLEWLGNREGGAHGLEHQLAYYRRFLDSTARPGREQPVAEATWEWLVAHKPEEKGDVVLCWGDARIGNVIWQDFRPAAVLDWEMATLGQPELDLGWWLYFDRQFAEGLGMPRPAGFASHEETVARYEELLGRPMSDLFFYQVFSGFKFAIIMCKLSDLLIDSGVLPVEMDMATNNLATQFTATLLGLPQPS